MGKRSTRSRSESRPEWEQLEDWVRGHVQRLIQELLEEEVTEFGVVVQFEVDNLEVIG